MSESQFVVEPALFADAPRIAELARDEIETGLGWQYRTNRIRELIRENETVVLVARPVSAEDAARELAGFGVMRYQKRAAHLLLLAVAPQYRRHGVAMQIIRWLEKTALYAGIEHVQLEVREHNENARKFYRKAGYKDLQLIPDYYSGAFGESENAWRMLHRIGRAEQQNSVSS